MFDNPYVETFFTRSNNRCGCIFGKMDKTLFDLNWLIAHPKTLVEFFLLVYWIMLPSPFLLPQILNLTLIHSSSLIFRTIRRASYKLWLRYGIKGYWHFHVHSFIKNCCWNPSSKSSTTLVGGLAQRFKSVEAQLDATQVNLLNNLGLKSSK